MTEVKTIYAVKFDYYGKEMYRKKIGVARFGLLAYNNAISWRKYRELANKADKAFKKYKREYLVIMDEDNRRINQSVYGFTPGCPVRFE